MGEQQRRTKTLKKPIQFSLWRSSPDHVGGVQNISEAFRRLYFHLYTNSEATRADRIIGDLSLLLLVKLAAEKSGDEQRLIEFLERGGDPSIKLLPLIHEYLPSRAVQNQKLHIGEDAARHALAELLAVDLSRSPAHVLGEAFQALIGPKIRGERGQFFTPHTLVRAMVEVVAPTAAESVLDPACGTGGFLVEAHAHQAKTGTSSALLAGVDKDADLTDLASTLLRIATGQRGRVECRDSLDIDSWTGDMTPGSFDVVLTNPPFGARIGVKDRRILQQFDLGHAWSQGTNEGSWHKKSDLLVDQDPQVLFLELCVRMLRPGGRMGIVLPEGVFGNRSQAYIWEWIRSSGRITALLDCPRTTFQPGTDTKTNVLFFTKLEPAESPHNEFRNVRVGVALSCGHDRRGRTHLPDGRPYPDDFSTLANTYRTPNPTNAPWRLVDRVEPTYLVPRYYIEEVPATAEEQALVMGSEVRSLGELTRAGVLAIRKGNEVGAEAYGTGDVPFVRTSDLSNFEIRTDPTKSVSEEFYAQYRDQQKLRPGDVLIVVDGRYRIGTSAILTERNYRCLVQSHIRILSILDKDVVDAYELLFALNLPSVRLRIRDLVFVQSTLGTLGKRLFELRVPLLHGDGPWSERVKRFREALEGRDRLLAELSPLAAREIEL